MLDPFAAAFFNSHFFRNKCSRANRSTVEITNPNLSTNENDEQKKLFEFPFW